ncbi:MAG: endo alpha-1,4 polygalactosaminidase [Actinobacteria bacterium]|nr:endo alpha-1,4 polygalactosaminidase [Actinomycetota bacterium]
MFHLSPRLGRRHIAVSLAIALAAAALTILIGQQRVKAAGAWPPPPDAAWHITLQGDPGGVIPGVAVYEVDLFDAAPHVISDRQNAGATVVCYFSGGTHEDWRPDAPDFPDSILGNALGDWPGERWLDVSNLAELAPIMERRLDLAVDMGCDAVDPDNVDAFTHNTGFGLTQTDQINYVRFLADQAHSRGLMIGLKNALSIAGELAPDVDFAINESCQLWNECELLTPFADLAKPIFAISYGDSSACSQVWGVPVHLVIKERSLFADPWQACQPPTDYEPVVMTLATQVAETPDVVVVDPTVVEPGIEIEPPIFELPTTTTTFDPTPTTAIEPPIFELPTTTLVESTTTTPDPTPTTAIEPPIFELPTTTTTPDPTPTTAIEPPIFELPTTTTTGVEYPTTTLLENATPPPTYDPGVEIIAIGDEATPDEVEIVTQTTILEDEPTTTVTADPDAEPVTPDVESDLEAAESVVAESTTTSSAPDVTSTTQVPRWKAATERLAQKFTDAILARFTPERVQELQTHQAEYIAKILKALKSFMAGWMSLWQNSTGAGR